MKLRPMNIPRIGTTTPNTISAKTNKGPFEGTPARTATEDSASMSAMETSQI
jgi:hypothetical protein